MVRRISTYGNSGLAENVRFFQPKMLISFAELVDFPRVVFFGSTRLFRITRTFAGYRISEDILRMLWQSSRRISEDDQQCSIFLKVIKITEDALFVEPGGSLKINFFDSAQFAELVGWPKMFDNVRIFLGGCPRCRSVVFRRSQKIGRVNNEWYSERVSVFISSSTKRLRAVGFAGFKHV